MTKEVEDILEIINDSDELVHLLETVDNIAVIEYNHYRISGSIALSSFMEKHDIDNSVVKNIVTFKHGRCIRRGSEDEDVELDELFPEADIHTIDSVWKKVKPETLNVANTLVIHFVDNEAGYICDLNENTRLRKIVNATRCAYYAVIANSNSAGDLFSNGYSCQIKGTLDEFDFDEPKSYPSKTDFCKDRMKYMEDIKKKFISKDFFFQCIDEVEHGCEKCNQCDDYSSRKNCPMAQRLVAKSYREGLYVPQDLKIAHQWEAMAARQEYIPAIIQLADDMMEGCGCKKNVEKALETYRKYATEYNDTHCVNRLLEWAKENDDVNNVIAIPYIVRMAEAGDEDMTMLLSESFQNGNFGLPIDIEQQKQWIEEGANNGNPRFIMAMAEMYENDSNWKQAYHWYQELEEYEPALVPDGKIEEIELRMLTNGMSDEDMAIKGEQYLFGYKVDRDVHLAFRCLEYAHEHDIPFGTGLLGYMYYNGIDVLEDTVYGKELLVQASEAGDLWSMDKLTDIYCEEDEYDSVDEWKDAIHEAVDKGIEEDSALAYYLKAHYQDTGWLYSCADNMEIYDNYQKAAELGHPIAQYELAMINKEGRFFEETPSEYRKWILKSAENGYYKAQGHVGVERYKQMFLSRPDAKKVFKMLFNAYEQGYEDACYSLGKAYMFGRGTTKNLDKAYPLYLKAADEGEAEAQEKLCEAYFRGNEVLKKNYKECAKYGEMAIANGRRGVRFETAYSQSHIGHHDRAKELYLELANEGNSAAMNNYACELSDSKEKAVWFLKAAEHGDDYGMWNIAKYYKDGTGVEKDMALAISYYEKAANKGHNEAAKDLANLYRYGRGVDRNVQEALKWFQKAADNKDEDALMEIINIYTDIDNECFDIEKGLSLLKEMAEKGKVTALLRLGEIYEDGIGVEEDKHAAIYWYRKAANKDNYSAKEALERLGVNWLEDDDENDDGIFISTKLDADLEC